MRLKLSNEEITLLKEQNIEFWPRKNYSKFEILILSEEIYDKESEISNVQDIDDKIKRRDLCDRLNNLAKKISDFVQI